MTYVPLNQTERSTLGPGSATRDETIAQRAESGECLTAIGNDYAMTRERVRQIVAKTSTMPNADIREARRRARENARRDADTEKALRVRQAAQDHPDATLSTLVALTGYPVAVVRDSLDWTERERRADQQQYSFTSDEDVLAEVRRVAALPGGEPLTGRFYDTHRTGGVSHARLLQRFKTWTAACEAAQVTPNGANPGRVYTRNWTDAEMTRWVWDYLTSADNPSYARFEVWLRTQMDAPSAQTIRNSLGSWVEMKRLAIDTFAAATA